LNEFSTGNSNFPWYLSSNVKDNNNNANASQGSSSFL